MVKVVRGDLFKAPESILAHGVNCQGVFGAGVAAQMAKFYPASRADYMAKATKEGWFLGNVQFVHYNGKTIANCATQYDYGPGDSRYVSYDAVRATMQKVKEYAKNNGLSVAMPKIGAGLAGGNWDIIKSILDEVFQDYDVTVYVLE